MAQVGEARLSEEQLLAATSAPDAEAARAIDLRGLQLTSVEPLARCRSLELALLSSNLLTAVHDSVLACSRLRKLDLSGNGISTLPKREDWTRLPDLQILYLHQNQLGSLKVAGRLSSLPKLVRVTLFDNPLATHPNYRHFLVNSLFSLRALDLHVISDEELIEGAQFPTNFAALSEAALLPVFEHREGQPPAGSRQPPDQYAILKGLTQEIVALNKVHAKLSPVLHLQGAVRGLAARGTVKTLRKRTHAAVVVQRHTRGHMSRMFGGPVGGGAGAPDDAAAAMTIQKSLRGRQERREIAENRTSAALLERAYERMGAEEISLPYLYVQLRHVEEMQSLALGAIFAPGQPERDEPLVAEQTGMYTIRHAAEPPLSLSPPPLLGLLVRRRWAAAERHTLGLGPPPTDGLPGLRLRASKKQARALAVLHKRRTRPSANEAELLRARRASQVSRADVPEAYAMRRLVRLVLPSASYISQIMNAVEARNRVTVRQMGISEADLRASPSSREGGGQQALGPKALAEMIVPLRQEDLDSSLAALTIQRVARAAGTRRRLAPLTLPVRLLRLRGAQQIQRWWRMWLMLERLRMLTLVRARTVAVTTNKLFLPRTLFESLSGRPPLHAAELWPEHKLQVSFTAPPEAAVQLSRRPEDEGLKHLAARPGLPTWSSPPVAQAAVGVEASPNMQEPLALLTVGARIAPVDKKRFGSFVHAGWTCVCYQTTAEAARRAALLTMVGYDPIAARAVHGKMQGKVFQPLVLLSADEVSEQEAACAVQGAFRGRKERAPLLEAMKARRVEVATQHEQAEQRAAAHRPSKHSLLNQAGELPMPRWLERTVPAVAQRGMHEAAHASWRLPLRLDAEQVAGLVARQAVGLDILGLPPAVSGYAGYAAEQSRHRQQMGAKHREEAAVRRQEVATRQMAEIVETRRFIADGRSTATASAAGGSAGEGGGGGGEGGGEGWGGEGGNGGGLMSAEQLSAAAQLLQMQRLLHTNAVVRAEEAMEQAEVKQGMLQAKQEQASAVRQWYAESKRELQEEKEAERTEQLEATRAHKRQLNMALQLQRQAEAQEQARLRDKVSRQRAKVANRGGARDFAGAFVRRQNAMARQLGLGDSRRRQTEGEMANAERAHAVRTEQQFQRARAAAQRLARAEARRMGVASHRDDTAKQLAAREVEHRYELDVIKFKKQQLREIKALLSRPMPQSPTSDGGFSDGEAFFGGADGFADPELELPPMAGDKPRAGADSAVTGFEPPDSAGTDSTLFGAGMRGLDLTAPGQGESVGATPPGTAGEQAAMAALAMQ